MRRLFLCGVALFLGCAGREHRPTPIPGSEKIAVSTDMPQGCEEVGEISGTACQEELADAMSGAKSGLRNQAHALNANYVKLETNNSRTCTGSLKDGTEILLTGRAFKCAAADAAQTNTTP
jgi:hypothetical protein